VDARDPRRSNAECGRRGGNKFLIGSDDYPNRSDDNLHHPDKFLLEREDILERCDTFPSLSDNNLKVSDNLIGTLVRFSLIEEMTEKSFSLLLKS
jgi:hypothetical protein